MIKVLQELASECVTLVVTRLVHAQRDTVQDDHKHADTLEPSDMSVKENMWPVQGHEIKATFNVNYIEVNRYIQQEKVINK